jgi:2-phospho-L-lactate guanylyltransferase
VQVAVVVPVKAFSDAKGRLADVLGPTERAALARTLATRVVRAARGLPVFVVCDDDDVADWARGEGATVAWRPARGLDDAASFGVGTAAASGCHYAVVAHGDLPRADDLTVAVGFAGVTIVPDRHDDGTNVLAIPVDAGFMFHYGPGSFARHLAEAGRLGLAVRVLRDDSLAWDVDVPGDLPDDLVADLAPSRDNGHHPTSRNASTRS